MIEFEVSEPFELPTVIDKYGIWHLDTKKLNDFWEQHDSEKLGMWNGCYIFGMSTKRVKPWYVGKTWRGFKNEVFKPYQQTRISKFINSHGTPVVVFVYKKYKKKEGVTTRKIIRALENFLIQTAVSVNPELLNVQGIEAGWSIKGLVRSKAMGKPSEARYQFARMLNLP